MADIIRRDPFQELNRLWPWPRMAGREWFRPFFGPRFPEVTEWVPTCDVTEQDDAIIVQAELPGVDPKDVEVSLEDDVLTVRGEKRSERKEEKNGRTYSERTFGSFERSITIPGGADPAKIEATLKDGVLSVRVPRQVPAPAQPKRIEIKSS